MVYEWGQNSAFGYRGLKLVTEQNWRYYTTEQLYYNHSGKQRRSHYPPPPPSNECYYHSTTTEYHRMFALSLYLRDKAVRYDAGIRQACRAEILPYLVPPGSKFPSLPNESSTSEEEEESAPCRHSRKNRGCRSLGSANIREMLSFPPKEGKEPPSAHTGMASTRPPKPTPSTVTIVGDLWENQPKKKKKSQLKT